MSYFCSRLMWIGQTFPLIWNRRCAPEWNRTQISCFSTMAFITASRWHHKRTKVCIWGSTSQTVLGYCSNMVPSNLYYVHVLSQSLLWDLLPWQDSKTNRRRKLITTARSNIGNYITKRTFSWSKSFQSYMFSSKQGNLIRRMWFQNGPPAS